MQMRWLIAAALGIAAASTIAITGTASAAAPGALGRIENASVPGVERIHGHYRQHHWGWYAPWYRPYYYAPPPIVHRPAPYYYAPYYYPPTYYYYP